MVTAQQPMCTVITRICKLCGHPLPAHTRASYCGPACRTDARVARERKRSAARTRERAEANLERIAARIEDVEWLLEMGETPHAVASRLNTTVGALGKWLREHQQPDLARPFEREQTIDRERDRRKKC